MYLVILILVLLNFFSTLGWLSLLTNLVHHKINFERYFVFKSVIMDFVFLLVPMYYPSIMGGWILFTLFYLVVGFLITAHEGKKVKKDLNIK
ncbi:hypothetical protein CLV55_103119 [Flavobacterium aciduliphilum]|uniref:Uncharacterized protein n=1 Tax=Flavobacterium aciduliphilum TaxID=1101402 RepID=A0A328YJT0_9FLAO|nr:hypothetical protein CLV55_103119 [Flavobacterium aciduliphilum]